MFQRPKKDEPRYYDYYWSKDPAFDQDSDKYNYEAWSDTGDSDHLPRNGGMRPFTIQLRRFSSADTASLQDFSRSNPEGWSRYIYLVVAAASVKISDAFGPEDDWVPNRVKIDGLSCADDAFFEALCEHEGLMQELFDFVNEKEAGSPRG